MNMLHEFLTANREEIIERTSARVVSRSAHLQTRSELAHGVPMFLSQLIDTLCGLIDTSHEIAKSAALHGGDLLKSGFTVAQVVHGYGDVCQVVTELALARQMSIATDDFRTFNRCLDEAIAQAVTEYARQREQEIFAAGTLRLGHLTHELRNLLNTAMLSFETLKSGSVGISGSTGALLGRSLLSLRNLVDRSIAEVRLHAHLQERKQILVAEFIEEIEIAAALEAKLLGVVLIVPPVEYGVVVEASRELLTSALHNLLQNAFKFTRPHGHVLLTVQTTAEHVLLEVEDECGGLKVEDPETLFRPFEQRSTDRTGLGLGLSICRQSAEASGGKLYVRDLPGKGCVFVIELPRQPPPPQ